MRIARLQTNELGRTDNFFGSLLSRDDIKEVEKIAVVEAPKAPVVNGAALPFRTDVKPRFSDPPAPPPQQPLPEKPDVARSHPMDPSSPSLKRSNTERPKSVPNTSPIRQEPGHINAMLEELKAVRKELEVSSARMRDLEEQLAKEREARELAEERAKELQLQSETISNGIRKAVAGGSVIEEAFEPPSETPETKEVPIPEVPLSKDETIDTKSISYSSLLLEKRLEAVLVEIEEMKSERDALKSRADAAESERDADRKTLAEMVEKIRVDEAARRSSSTERARSPASQITAGGLLEGDSEGLESLVSLLKNNGVTNGHAVGPLKQKDLGAVTGIMPKNPGGHDPMLHNTAPYASMLGVVLLGMGIMAYLNGWQPPKVDR